MSTTLGAWPLPLNWAWISAGEIGEVDLGRQRSPKNHSGPNMRPYVRSANITWNGWDFSDVKEMNFNDDDYKSFRLVPGDILLNEGSGSAGEVGKPAVWEGQIEGCCFQNTLLRFRSVFINPWYARAFFSFSARAGNLVKHTQGVNIFHIGKSGLEIQQIPVPPLNEQRRIVEKIEGFALRSSCARSEIGQIYPLVKRLKRSIIKRAFSEKSTQESRGRRSSSLGWLHTSLGEIADIQSGITLGKKYSEDTRLVSLPYLRVANVQRGYLDLDDVKTIKITCHEASRLYLQAGDILMNEGGDRDKLGRGWIWENQIENCIHQNHVFRVRLFNKKYPPELISIYANEFGQSHFFDEGKQTTNLASISKKKLSTLPIILPPEDEAVELLKKLRRALGSVEIMEKKAILAQDHINRLDQAILTKAFRGELVPQDPNDEPASILLDRIRAERAAAGPALKRGRRRRTAAGA